MEGMGQADPQRTASERDVTGGCVRQRKNRHETMETSTADISPDQQATTQATQAAQATRQAAHTGAASNGTGMPLSASTTSVKKSTRVGLPVSAEIFGGASRAPRCSTGMVRESARTRFIPENTRVSEHSEETNVYNIYDYCTAVPLQRQTTD